jgi:hypothetical protein
VRATIRSFVKSPDSSHGFRETLSRGHETAGNLALIASPKGKYEFHERIVPHSRLRRNGQAEVPAPLVE